MSSWVKKLHYKHLVKVISRNSPDCFCEEKKSGFFLFHRCMCRQALSSADSFLFSHMKKKNFQYFSTQLDYLTCLPCSRSSKLGLHTSAWNVSLINKASYWRNLTFCFHFHFTLNVVCHVILLTWPWSLYFESQPARCMLHVPANMIV